MVRAYPARAVCLGLTASDHWGCFKNRSWHSLFQKYSYAEARIPAKH
jgi:hypothetical protein